MPVPAQNQQYENFIIRYKQNTHGGFDYESDETFQIVNDLFGILYVPMQKVPELELSSYSYSSIPRCYTYMDTGALSTSGVTRLHNHPYLKLQGKGTLVAVIDSGIDYLHPAFHNGVQSKIFSIWDQTLEGGADGRIPFGREFGRQQIEQALASENPWEIVPSSDTNGHGTRSAATAAGYRIEKDNFCGEAAEKFGSQCVVLAIDAKRRPGGGWNIYKHGGRLDTGLDAIEWAKKAEALGAGEILLTSMDCDGTKSGYDIELTRAISDAVSIPVIASGGAGTLEHFYDALTEGGADAALAASLFHYKELEISQVKDYLADRGISVRR